MHEPKFSAFLRWATFPKESTVQSSEEQAIKLSNMDHPHVIQLVKQINFGALESVRYFAATGGKGEEEAFHEVEEADLIAANYQKVNTSVTAKMNRNLEFDLKADFILQVQKLQVSSPQQVF